MSEENTVKAYDAGCSVPIDSSGVTVPVDFGVYQLLVYPTVDAKLTLNDGATKEVFLPANMWTPIVISRDYNCVNFVLTAEEAGLAHWQGWVM